MTLEQLRQSPYQRELGRKMCAAFVAAFAHSGSGDGVLVFWLMETNAVCIYAQARNFSHSEVAAMVGGLIRHDTEMRIEKNFVDSHGQRKWRLHFAICWAW